MPPVIIYPNEGALFNLELLRTALELCNVKLYQNDYVPSALTVIGDLTEADFGGYAAINVAELLPAYIDPNGGASAQIATIQWNATGVAPSNVIYGFWVETAGGDLILVGRFEAPVPMGSLGDALPLDIKFTFPN